jgi:hypothetical protein
LIDHDVRARREVYAVDVCAAALVVEKCFLHHAPETAATLCQFPREVDQRATIVLANAVDDGGGSNCRLDGQNCQATPSENM